MKRLSAAWRNRSAEWWMESLMGLVTAIVIVGMIVRGTT